MLRENDRIVINEERVVESEETHRLADGPHIFLSIRFPLRDVQNRIVAIGGISTDITDRKNAENEAREAVVRRDQFLAMLSHELRNPLGAILNATQLLGREALDKSIAQSAQDVIQRQVSQMARLLDDLLDVTARGAESHSPTKVRPRFVRIITEAVEVVHASFASASVQLHIDLGSRPLVVFGDSARLQQMLVNLLLNAAKYTKAGGQVRLTAVREAAQIIIRIKDTGVGIRPEMLERIFHLFVQANETLDRSEGGMGVGLTLVRTIVEMHDGKVQAFSEGPGSGSEFVVRLPYSSQSLDTTPPPPAAPSGSAKVLIVEDNPDSRSMLEAILKLDGYDVTTAADGKDGLAAILNQRPRFAIVDIGLPGLDGYQVAKQVRKECTKDQVYLIALTGYGRSEDRRAVEGAGFDAHLVKPLKPTELAAVMDRASKQ